MCHRNPLAQQLQAQFGRGVDENVTALRVNERRATIAMIARIRRLAHGTIAANYRHAHRRSRAEESESAIHACIVAAKPLAALQRRKRRLTLVLHRRRRLLVDMDLLVATRENEIKPKQQEPNRHRGGNRCCVQERLFGSKKTSLI